MSRSVPPNAKEDGLPLDEESPAECEDDHVDVEPQRVVGALADLVMDVLGKGRTP